ncbi:flavodoxin [Sphaerochaeta halotolerans]|uniref:Flavodoxin n=1 Tax=Sphaerochaeta halotolerans TaxID=2293840 RepID=A0A372MF15_9SPIR|nr:flavodoxin [Sphaerochaeta halotolerans]MBG0768019.1 flavodoxin [Spirochaetaceae bacterium]MDK2859211.1 flavodoxin [Sphaerochaeta sp.]MDN5333140.1 flavodoxin [Sphaerochaeta sp.]MXI85860.1 flavodoxin [Sphaerochaeta halotolerans]RFU94359.1 flavodoxin [Sphaerochaeta halotolerans]
MKRIAIVYYSGTGNTEALAQAVAKGAKEAGAEIRIIKAGLFSADMLGNYDAVAFGCPAMGSENLEDEVFEPMFDAILPHLSGKPVGLFGSYGWGNGEWMDEWAEVTRESGAVLVADPVIALDTPEEDSLEAAFSLGTALAG